MNYKNFPQKRLLHIISAPIIYGMIFPILFLDLCLEIYHRFCFPCYGLPIIKRNSYIKIDRHKLRYLSLYDKMNCIYCGYANGLINYTRVIAGETEKYWCGIKHEADSDFNEPEHHKDFIAYGDEEAYIRLNSKNSIK